MDGLSLPLESIMLQAALMNGFTGSAPALAASAIKVVTSLAVVLGLLLVVLAWSRRVLARGTLSSQGTTMRIVGGLSLGLKKNICLVEVPGSILVLGVAGDSISLLTTIDKTDAQDMSSSPRTHDEGTVPVWNRLSLFTPGSGIKKDAPQLLSFFKGKLLRFAAPHRINRRLYPVPVGKHEQE